MNSLYVKGGLNHLVAPAQPPPDGVPNKDLTFSQQRFEWAIDFNALKIRRESEFVIPRFKDRSADVAFVRKVGTDLVSNNEYRFFRSKTDNPWIEKKNWELKISPGILPFIEPDSLPIFWTAGCVCETIVLDHLKAMVEQSKWVFAGKGTKGGHDCFVITMPEGKAGNAVREYWVRATLPYPIVFCSMRASKGTAWQVEVDYKSISPDLIPSKITYTVFAYPSTSVSYQRTYNVDEFRVNQEFENAVFEHELKPGTTVMYQGKKGLFEVDEHRQIVEYRDKPDNRRLLMRVAIICALCIGIGVVLFLYLRRRKNAGASVN